MLDNSTKPKNHQHKLVGETLEITVAEAATIKNVSKATIYNWIKQSRITTQKSGHKLVVLVDVAFEQIQAYKKSSAPANDSQRNQNQRFEQINQQLQDRNFSLQHELQSIKGMYFDLAQKHQDALLHIKNLEDKISCYSNGYDLILHPALDIDAHNSIPEISPNLLFDSRMGQKLLPPPNGIDHPNHPDYFFE